jgi:hypothetical protein
VFAAPSGIYSKDGMGSNGLIEAGCKIYLRPSQLAIGEYSPIINEPADKKTEKLDDPAPGDLQKRIVGMLQGKLKTIAGCRLIAT